MKHCKKCNATKSVIEFSVRTASKDGLQSQCKSCNRLEAIRYDAKNPGVKHNNFLNWVSNNPGQMKQHALKRLTAIKNATPPWANLEAMKVMKNAASTASKACGIKYVTDHIYPIQGENICGLNIAANIQLLTRSDNAKKYNSWTQLELTPY